MLQSLTWVHPLDLAARLDDSHIVLLYSGVQASYSGRYSYLACDLAETITGHDFEILAGKLSDNQEPFENAWFGYLGYGLKNSLETCEAEAANWLDLPDLYMMRFNRIYRFDHQEQSLQLWSSTQADALMTEKAKPCERMPAVTDLFSNMSTDDYLAKAADIIQRIHNGDLYQANLTRKFGGYFAREPDYFSVFRILCEVTPAPYSAFMRIGDIAIASSSPEQLLAIAPNGQTRTRPIKGTAPRFADAAKDQLSREALAQSGKDQAENLMIVDLMRNDLAKTAIPGSVQVERLFEVTSHATIHHLSSSIASQKSPHHTSLDVVKHCFPPGSMTGAPKIAAMHVCSELEQQPRGVYSGAIGWFGGDGSCELSVVIRTLMLQARRFEFQVGGGIVADSDPIQELEETIEKAKGILQLLAVSPDRLRRL